MKKLFIAGLLAISSYVIAAPTLSASTVLASQPQPATADYNVNGGPWIGCNLIGTTTKTPKCDLSNITVIGTYVLTLRYTWEAGCAEGGLGPCWAAGEASSVPFTYRWLGVPVLKPTGIKITAT